MSLWRYGLFTVGFLALALLGIPLWLGDQSTDVSEEKSFQEFMVQYNRSYLVGSSEYFDRMAKFKVSLGAIRELNSKRKNADSAEFGITEFADMSPEEFTDQILSQLASNDSDSQQHHNNRRKHHHHHHHNNNRKARQTLAAEIPQSIDWKARGMTTAVKNQQLCGACWTFSVIETVESMAAISHKVMQELSVQHGVDCARNGNAGCDGGDTCAFAQWLSSNKVKIPPAAAYPYLGTDDVCRRISAESGGVQIAGNHTCQNLVGKEDKLTALLALHGPVAAAVNALPWMFYVSGVMDGNCPSTPLSLNHAVQIVGYDLSAFTPHYHVRNSWGTLWGERGYARVAYGHNTCGIATRITSLDVL